VRPTHVTCSCLAAPGYFAPVGYVSYGPVVVRGQLARLQRERVGDEVVLVVATSASAEACSEALTARERAVLTLVPEGLTDREAAARLGIRPSTVRTHVEHARDKLGAKKRGAGGDAGAGAGAVGMIGRPGPLPGRAGDTRLSAPTRLSGLRENTSIASVSPADWSASAPRSSAPALGRRRANNARTEWSAPTPSRCRGSVFAHRQARIRRRRYRAPSGSDRAGAPS
jgi:hypothetical protein